MIFLINLKSPVLKKMSLELIFQLQKNWERGPNKKYILRWHCHSLFQWDALQKEPEQGSHILEAIHSYT